MNKQEMNKIENSTDESLVLGEEELNLVTGGVGMTNNMICPRCRKETLHMPTEDGRYVCNSCKLIHEKI